jgi:glycerophosphoryl diester phosphodiesterase
MSSARPVNIAHRGASAYAPEHTLAAYRLAIDMGADFVEQDLQLTRDGVLVCLHDAGLERTTDVEEIFPDRGVEREIRGETRRVWPVSEFTLDEIRRLDAGSWFGVDFAGVRIPTFQEAIDLVKGKAGIYPETKDPDDHESLGFEMEAELARVLAENGLDSAEAQAATPVYIQSFSPDSLKRMRAQTGSVYRLIQLVRTAQADILMTDKGLAEVAEYATGIGPSLRILLSDPSRAVAARRVGLEIHPYTVRASDLPAGFSDASSLMSYLFDEIGVTGVFTDNPDLFPAPK